MMLSQQEISDRLEIQDLMVRYCHAVDTRQWDLLDEVFTEDALIDYTATGGARGNLAEIKEFLAEVLPAFPAFQHLIANPAISVDGDAATGRTMCHNPLVLPDGGVLNCGFWYLDTFVRVDGTWRIKERVEEASYSCTVPPPPT
ncbi:nuclear transport factor 2 family protein [Saccharopolyspora sp. WRP15-2]|uniref:Nuclear transport factor 2 family protein n=1 Tax=Saccharopolyspora oryzae TaxID=2997343 RepID=A0ABT4V987_9PSEU|nr:nuclear transport factor 2 family protein [Saccharopolyspora oryzae]MDA3630520.1 nuclear transport factor 2 family protein [Saccharopolyspora oryzae]